MNCMLSKNAKMYRMYKNNRKDKDIYIRCDFSENNATSYIYYKTHKNAYFTVRKELYSKIITIIYTFVVYINC